MNNKDRIAEYIKNGAKKTDKIGIELEHFVVDSVTDDNIPYSGKHGVGEILSEISEFYDKKVYSEGFLIGLSNGRYHLTLEPSAQLEISICPVGDISEADKIYNEFSEIVTPVLKEHGCKLLTVGTRPKGTAAEQELIPKKRYKFMNEYFEHTGTCGKNMMRQTASTQVSVDYADEKDCVMKFRAANILSPLFALICDNSTVLDGKSYDGRMIRTYIWQNVDNDRCGTVPCTFDRNFGFDGYAEYIYNNPAVLIMENGMPVFTGEKKISDIYGKKELDEAEIEHLLSMFFPDVRLKQYIEIRPADSMPISYALSYAAFIKGIFKSADKFVFDGVTVSDINKAKAALSRDGFNAEVYGKNAALLCDVLLDTAKKNLGPPDAEYLRPIEKIIAERRTLRDSGAERG